ncbi:MAG TPA: guanine deaminase [Propionicimonas sp.]|nr:guanine deaminase [Propionicimonas sp.]
MTLYRAMVLDTIGTTIADCELRVDADAGIAVRGGVVLARGPFAEMSARFPDEPVETLADGIMLPGLVDTHLHVPQVRAMGGIGLPLLGWLERYALPEEQRLADRSYAEIIAAEFIDQLLAAGTTTALAFGAHFAPAVDAVFAAAAQAGVRLITGLVVSDRGLPEALLTTPEDAYAQGLELAQKWHGTARLGYAVTPRFSLSASEAMLESCAALQRAVPGAWFTSHINENDQEIAEVKALFGVPDYLASYTDAGLVDGSTVLAHNLHPQPSELGVLVERGAAVAHCPSSNAMLGSGPFGLRQHVDAGVTVSLGTDVGAGVGFSLLSEARHAYMTQRQLGERGYDLSAAQLLYLATTAGARALGLHNRIGDLGEGKQFDAILINPWNNPALMGSLRTSDSAEAALAAVFTLSGPGDVQRVWIGGQQVR